MSRIVEALVVGVIFIVCTPFGWIGMLCLALIFGAGR